MFEMSALGGVSFSEVYWLPEFECFHDCVYHEREYVPLGKAHDFIRFMGMEQYLVPRVGIDVAQQLRDFIVSFGAKMWVETMYGLSFQKYAAVDIVKKVCRPNEAIPEEGMHSIAFSNLDPMKRVWPDFPTTAVYWINRTFVGKKVFDDAWEQPEVVLRSAPEGMVHPEVLHMIDVVGVQILMDPQYTNVRMQSGQTIQSYWEGLVSARRSIVAASYVNACIQAERSRLMIQNRSRM